MDGGKTTAAETVTTETIKAGEGESAPVRGGVKGKAPDEDAGEKRYPPRARTTLEAKRG